MSALTSSTAREGCSGRTIVWRSLDVTGSAGLGTQWRAQIWLCYWKCLLRCPDANVLVSIHVIARQLTFCREITQLSENVTCI